MKIAPKKSDIPAYGRRLEEKDPFAILIKTRDGIKIIETFPNLEELKREYAHMEYFSRSSFYPKNTEPPFPAEFKKGVTFDGPLEYSVLENLLQKQMTLTAHIPNPEEFEVNEGLARANVEFKRSMGLVGLILGGILLFGGCQTGINYLKNKYFPTTSATNIKTNYTNYSYGVLSGRSIIGGQK